MTDPTENTTMVVLRSNDGQDFDLKKEAAFASEFVRDSLEGDDDNDDDDDAVKAVDVMRVNGACLAKVVEFLKHHDEDPMPEIPTPLGGSTIQEVMGTQWYQDFVEEESMPQYLLFEILTAANYMGIKPLLDLACLKVTFQLNGKDAEEIRQILNLPVLTPEEEAQAREEHRWIFEDAHA